jgi:hypothetical protein
MTLEEIDASLPAGFHDAWIKSIAADYTKRRAMIELDIWIAEGPDDDEVQRNAYRPAEVMIEGLQFLAMEPPVSRPQAPTAMGLEVDFEAGPQKWTHASQRHLPKDCFASRFYVHAWCSFIYVAARTAALAWKGNAYDVRRA